jgi:hypothetical protein
LRVGSTSPPPCVRVFYNIATNAVLRARAAVGIPVAIVAYRYGHELREAAMLRLTPPRASQIPPDTLRHVLRARLAAGTLVRAQGGCWVHSASGKNACAVCVRAIPAGAPECEVVDRVRLYAHMPCFKLWVEESRAHESGGPPAPAESPGAKRGSLARDAGAWARGMGLALVVWAVAVLAPGGALA